MEIRFTLVIVFIIVQSSLTIFAQNNNDVLNQRLVIVVEALNTVSKSMLDKATKIQYSFSNGTVAPQYHYSYHIDVTTSAVIVTIYRGYDGENYEHYDKVLTVNEYRHFKTMIESQRISKVHIEDYSLPCSRSTESFTIYKGKAKLISIDCDKGELQIKKGKIEDEFFKILSDEQKQVISQL